MCSANAQLVTRVLPNIKACRQLLYYSSSNKSVRLREEKEGAEIVFISIFILSQT